MNKINHLHFDSTDSTNTQLINQISDNLLSADIPHLCTTDYQSQGRGQHGRIWESGANNVLLSLYVPINTKYLHELSGLLSLSIGFELSQLTIIQKTNDYLANNNYPIIGVKWANDLGFYDSYLKLFKKLAGILIESVFKKTHNKNTLVGVVIGIGLNVGNSPVIKDGLYQATSLHSLYPDLSLSAKELYLPIVDSIFKAIHHCNHFKDSEYLKSFIDRFNTHHLLTQRQVQIFMQNNMTDIHQQGRCIGIGNHGELLLQYAENIIPVFAGMAKIVD